MNCAVPDDKRKEVIGNATPWKSMRTAPRFMQKQILTYRSHWYQTSFWSKQHKCWVGWPKNVQPTHWMPLPDEPA